MKFNQRRDEVEVEIADVKRDINDEATELPDPKTLPGGDELKAEIDQLVTRARDLSNTFTKLLPPLPQGGGLFLKPVGPPPPDPHELDLHDDLEEYSKYAKELRKELDKWRAKRDASRELDENIKNFKKLLDKAKDAVKGAFGKIGKGPAGSSPGGPPGGGGFPGGRPGVDGPGGWSNLGGNRSGRGPGGSQFMPGVGFFPGAGPGPGGVGHGVGEIGLRDNDAPGPWNGNGLGSVGKRPGGGTGRPPGSSGSKKGGSSGYSETGSKGSGDRVTGSDVDRNTGTGGGGGGGDPDERSPSQAHAKERAGRNDADGEHVDPNNVAPEHGDFYWDEATETWIPYSTQRPSDDDTGGGSEGPPIHKGGPYYTPHGGSTGGVGVIVAGGFGPRVPGSPVSYLDFLYKNVGPEGDGWGGNNPVVTPAIKPSDLFKPADDSIGPYNPKGTDYRPAPDDPTPGGPAGAAGRATRVRVG